MIRVALVDDHEMVREALGQILEDSAEVQVVGRAATCAGARALVVETTPDVLVLDYGLPDGSPLALIEQLAADPAAPRVVVLTVHESPHYAVRVLEAGALGFVIKAAAFRELIDGIRAAHRGEIFVSPALAPRVMAQLRRPKRERLGLDSLSNRELELLRLFGQGLGIQDAARIQNVSPSTASTYRTRLLEKLGMTSTADLIRFAIESGLD